MPARRRISTVTARYISIVAKRAPFLDTKELLLVAINTNNQQLLRSFR